MSNYDGRLTGLLYANEDIEVYIGRDQSVKIFDGMADNIVTSPDGLTFKAYDNLGLLQQEYIIEEYQSEWRDTDVGVIVRAIIEDSKWGVTGKYVRTDTGVTVGRVNYRWKSRLEAIRDLVALANTGSKKYVVFCDGDGYIHFRRYDDDTWPVAFMTTEDELNHVVEDLIDNDTLFLHWFDEVDGDYGSGTYEYWTKDDPRTPYEAGVAAQGRAIRLYTSDKWSLKARSRAGGWSQYAEPPSSGWGWIASGAALDIDVNQAFTIDVCYFPTDIGQMDLLHWDTPNPPQVHVAVGQNAAHCEIALGHSAGTMVWNPGITHDLNEWNYITLRANGGDVSLFKNGVLSAGTSTGFTWAIDANDVMLARDPYSSALTFDGYLDMLRFSKTAYSDQAIYNYARVQSSDMILTDISKQEMGGEKYNHCIVKYSDDVWAQYPDPMPDNPVTKMISTTSERMDHDCYLRAKAMVLTHREVPTRYKATAYTSRCDYRPNDLVEIYSPRYGIVGNFRLKNLTYTIRGNIRKMSMTLGEEREELTTLLAIAGL